MAPAYPLCRGRSFDIRGGELRHSRGAPDFLRDAIDSIDDAAGFSFVAKGNCRSAESLCEVCYGRQPRRPYSNGFNSPASNCATSGDFNGSSPSQSGQRNFRPPVLTSMNRMGSPHFRQIGGGVFLGTDAHAGAGASVLAHSHRLLPKAER
jgi:hypothetical protein